MDSKLSITIQSLFRGEGFTKATQATQKMSKDIKDAGGAVKDLAGSMGQFGGQIGKAAGGVGKLMGALGAGPISLIVAGVTTIIGAFINWRNTMSEVQHKMEELARTRHADMWQRMQENIAKAAKAQVDFFDKAIERAEHLRALAKQEESIRRSEIVAQAERKVSTLNATQAEADERAVRLKRSNLDNPSYTRERAKYENTQIDLDNRKQHIDTETRKENVLHNARMEQLQMDLRAISDEEKSVRDRVAEAKQRDEERRHEMQRNRKGANVVADDMQNETEYSELNRKIEKLRKKIDSGRGGASDRKSLLEKEERLVQLNKEIENKRKEAAKFEEDYNKFHEETLIKIRDLEDSTKFNTERRKVIIERMNSEILDHNEKVKKLQAEYQKTWIEINGAARDRRLKEIEGNMKREKEQSELAGKVKADKWKNSEFKDLETTQEAFNYAKKVVGDLQKYDEKLNNSVAALFPERMEQAQMELIDAQRAYSLAYKKAEDKLHQLAYDKIDMVTSHDLANMNRGFSEQNMLQAKIDSGRYSKSEVAAMQKELSLIQRDLDKGVKDLLFIAEMRSSVAKDGLEKQKAIENELSILRHVQERAEQRLEEMNHQLRDKTRGDLTGEGRKNRREREREQEFENERVARRQRNQDAAARRDAERGWGLDRNGNLVKTRRNAETLTKFQRERLQEYLRRKRLENMNNKAIKKIDSAEEKMSKNVQKMTDTLIKLSNTLDQAVKAQ